MREMKTIYIDKIFAFRLKCNTEKFCLIIKTLCLVALLVVALSKAEVLYAESGTLYTCSVHPSYKNPVTGKVEDSGGAGSYATGQGMVNSALGNKGLLEVTSKGEVYLNIKLKLMDHTSGHSFKIQSRDGAGWSDTQAGITAKGRDSNGTTSDVCIKLSSKNDLIRGEMYVNPMGRNVVFFIYTDNFSSGNNTDIKPAVVTKESGSGDATDKNKNNKNYSQDKKQKVQETDDSGDSSEGGLSLSTAQKKKDSRGKDNTILNQILITTVSIVIGGVILMIIALIFLYFMRDWLKDLFKTYPDDEYVYEGEKCEKN